MIHWRHPAPVGETFLHAEVKLHLPYKHSAEGSVPADTPTDTFSPLSIIHCAAPFPAPHLYCWPSLSPHFRPAICLAGDVVTENQENVVTLYFAATPTSFHFLVQLRVTKQHSTRQAKNQRGGYLPRLYHTLQVFFFSRCKIPPQKKLSATSWMWLCQFCGSGVLIARSACGS